MPIGGFTGTGLVIAEIIPVAAFLVIAYRLYRVASVLSSDRLLSNSIGFLLLSISQASMTLSIISSNPRVGISLYSMSTILAAGGFYALLPKDRVMGLHSISVIGLKSLLAFLDYIAGVLGLLVSSSSRGVARPLIALIGLSYIVRGSTLVLGVVGAGVRVILATLIVGELLRSASATILSIIYSVSRHDSFGEEEE